MVTPKTAVFVKFKIPSRVRLCGVFPLWLLV
jgi:hypothetical protein